MPEITHKSDHASCSATQSPVNWSCLAAGNPSPASLPPDSSLHQRSGHCSVSSMTLEGRTQPIIVPGSMDLNGDCSPADKNSTDFSHVMSVGRSAKGSSIMNSIPVINNDAYNGNSVGASSLEQLSSVPLQPVLPVRPYQILDDDEALLVDNPTGFMQNLCLDRHSSLVTKVVTVVGNAGEGKSHALNHIFFDGNEVFCTSTSCSGSGGGDGEWWSGRRGVSAAVARGTRALLLDTPGKTSTACRSTHTNRIILKAMAVSDIIIYRTRSERLQTDMYEFLSGFSHAYHQFFKEDFYNFITDGEKFADHMPVLIICHDTRNTNVLTYNEKGTPADQILATGKRLGFPLSGFSKIAYVGTCTTHGSVRQNTITSCLQSTPHSSPTLPLRQYSGASSPEEIFAGLDGEGHAQPEELCLQLLRNAVTIELASTTGRRSRKPSQVLEMLKLLTSKYSEPVQAYNRLGFPDLFLTCQERCLVCMAQCCRPLRHHMYTPTVGGRTAGAEQGDSRLVLDDRLGLQHAMLDTTNNNITATETAVRHYGGHACASGGGGYRTDKSNVGRRDLSHFSSVDCKFSEKYQNKRYNCSSCLKRGKKVTVLHRPYDSNQGLFKGIMNYAINGYVLECHSCGPIFYSRQKWVFSSEPDSAVVQVEHIHMWPSEPHVGYSTSTHTGRQLLEGVTALKSTVSSVAYSLPVAGLGSWFSDKIVNPDYWKPDADCLFCDACQCSLSSGIHHCRKCGLGFCQRCSSRTMMVPEKNWGDQLVRVCDACYQTGTGSPSDVSNTSCEETQVATRQVTEMCRSLLSAATNTAADLIRSSTRPNYWVADELISSCSVCSTAFDGSTLVLHHCRACGKGVCDACSPHRVPVKERGWDNSVRVCDKCYNLRRNIDYQVQQ